MPIVLKLDRNQNAQEICPFEGAKPRTFCTILSCVMSVKSIFCYGLGKSLKKQQKLVKT